MDSQLEDTKTIEIKVFSNPIMSNHRAYGCNSEKHAERTQVENLSDNFEIMLNDFNELTEFGTVLDVGCGVGRDLQYLSQLDNEQDLLGLDASYRMIEQARSNTSPEIDYIVGDMTNIPVRSESVDGVWCQAAIFMTGLDGMKKTISEFERILSSGGSGVVSFKLSDGESSKNGYQIRERWGEEIQYYFVDVETATDIVNNSGLCIEDTEKSSFKKTEFLNIWFSKE